MFDEHLYKHLYLPVCDTLLGQLEFRLDKESMGVAKAADALLRCKKDGMQLLVDQYADTIHMNSQLLASEIELFASTNKKITTDVIQKELTEDTLPNYYRMVQVALTLPVRTATAERSFSAMRRIRNYLRSTMGDERFSSLALLNIESGSRKQRYQTHSAAVNCKTHLQAVVGSIDPKVLRSSHHLVFCWFGINIFYSQLHSFSRVVDNVCLYRQNVVYVLIR